MTPEPGTASLGACRVVGRGVRATGGCACGGVRYRITGHLRDIVHCHCEPCRRITGHHMAATAALRSDVQFESEGSLRWYQRTDTVRYGFCSTCGATLFWEAADKADMVSIAGGTLDQPTGLTTVLAIWADDAADFHCLDDTIETHGVDQSDTYPIRPGPPGGGSDTPR